MFKDVPEPIEPESRPSTPPIDEEVAIDSQSDEDLLMAMTTRVKIIQLEVEKEMISLLYDMQHPRIAILDEEIAALRLVMEVLGIVRLEFPEVIAGELIFLAKIRAARVLRELVLGSSRGNDSASNDSQGQKEGDPGTSGSSASNVTQGNNKGGNVGTTKKPENEGETKCIVKHTMNSPANTTNKPSTSAYMIPVTTPHEVRFNNDYNLNNVIKADMLV